MFCIPLRSTSAFYQFAEKVVKPSIVLVVPREDSGQSIVAFRLAGRELSAMPKRSAGMRFARYRG
ncbi:MAG: hypothetical protein JSU63_21435 [Phycisphaerales bacterium]|nr:MAG: hypothetical protein JSU63_21435 [Phycisphaerales bacterium]